MNSRASTSFSEQLDLNQPDSNVLCSTDGYYVGFSLSIKRYLFGRKARTLLSHGEFHVCFLNGKILTISVIKIVYIVCFAYLSLVLLGVSQTCLALKNFQLFWSWSLNKSKLLNKIVLIH